MTDDDWDFAQALALKFWFQTDNPIGNARAALRNDAFLDELELTGLSPALMASLLINTVKTAPTAGTPEPILSLLQGLHDFALDATEKERLHLLIRQAEVMVAAADQAHDAYLLWNSVVFLDRAELRPILRTFRETDEKLVLTIVGGKDGKCGKSFSEKLIRHNAGVIGASVAYTNFEEVGTAEYAVEDLAVAIDPNLVMPRQDSSDDEEKWLRSSARRLVRSAQESGKLWWFVFDQCNKVPGGSNLVDFTDHFVRQMYLAWQPGPSSKTRLFLLGHDAELPTEIMGRDAVDVARLPVESDLAQLFVHELKRWRDQLEASGDLEENRTDVEIQDMARATAHAVWSKLGDNMTNLNEVVVGALDELL